MLELKLEENDSIFNGQVLTFLCIRYLSTEALESETLSCTGFPVHLSADVQPPFQARPAFSFYY